MMRNDQGMRDYDRDFRGDDGSGWMNRELGRSRDRDMRGGREMRGGWDRDMRGGSDREMRGGSDREMRGGWDRDREMRGARRGEETSGTGIVKVIEVLAQSPHGWEDATRRAVREAARTVRDIKSVYVKDMQAIVEGDEIVMFRINAKVSFQVHDDDRSSSRSEWR